MKNLAQAKARKDYDRIYAVVQSIPPGRVATYGQVADLAGLPGHSRQVGYALRVLPPESAVPWHRVVNARGEISCRRAPDSEGEQRMLLKEEGIVFEANGRIPLSVFQWDSIL